MKINNQEKSLAKEVDDVNSLVDIYRTHKRLYELFLKSVIRSTSK